MDPDPDIGVEETSALHTAEEGLRMEPVPDQQCDKGDQALQDDGEVLLVQGLQDFQGVVSTETVVVDDVRAGGGPRSYQQYQPVVVQGYVTSTGEVVHVVQDGPGGTSSAPLHRPQQQYQPCQPQMMNPDLYRLVNMFPDFSAKTLHRIFMMCQCDLKKALDQALFARQFRMLDSAASYSPIAPSAHFHHAQYRARPYMQMGLDGDLFRARGAMQVQQQQQQQQSPILLYQQSELHNPRDPRLTSSLAKQQLDGVVHINLAADDQVNLGDGMALLAASDLESNGHCLDNLQSKAKEGMGADPGVLLSDVKDPEAEMVMAAQAGEVR